MFQLTAIVCSGLKQLVLGCFCLLLFHMPVITAVSRSMKDAQDTINQSSTRESLLLQIRHGSMKNLPDISSINLEKRNIQYVAYGAFYKNARLRQLFLGSNPLWIPNNEPWFSHSGVAFLDISDCNLGPVNPIAFKDMPRLKLVDMSGNRGCVQSHKFACDAKAHYKVKCECEHKLECQRLESVASKAARPIPFLQSLFLSITGFLFTM